MRSPTYITLIIISIALLLTAIPSALATTLPEDKKSATILAYHRIDEDLYPQTNLRFTQFEAHIKEIVSGAYNVQALEHIIDSLKKGKNLPPQTIAITFEGGYKSILNKALPLLNEHNLPYTIFFASDLADASVGQYLNWQDIETINQQENASFGILPASYARLKNAQPEDIRRVINRARVKYRQHLNQEPTLFSYPFGEWSLALKNELKTQNFKAALGLHSGVSYPGSDFMALPRFSITENYGDVERFQLVSKALPLPVSDIEPRDPYLGKRKTPFNIGFTVHENLQEDLQKLNCYISGHAKPDIEIIGNRIELRPQNNITKPRIRANCTLPVKEQSWRWFSLLLTQDEEQKEIKEKAEPRIPEPAEPPAPQE